MKKTPVKKSAKVDIRLTPEEKMDWELKAHIAGVTIAELIRQAMKKVRAWNIPDRRLEQERTRQIARIGNNLNQIARWVNTYKSEIDTIEIIPYLQAIRESLDNLSTTQKQNHVD